MSGEQTENELIAEIEERQQQLETLRRETPVTRERLERMTPREVASLDPAEVKRVTAPPLTARNIRLAPAQVVAQMDPEVVAEAMTRE